MARIGSDIKVDAAFQKHLEHHRALLASVRAKGEIMKLGGGKDAIEKHRKKENSSPVIGYRS